MNCSIATSYKGFLSHADQEFGSTYFSTCIPIGTFIWHFRANMKGPLTSGISARVHKSSECEVGHNKNGNDALINGDSNRIVPVERRTTASRQHRRSVEEGAGSTRHQIRADSRFAPSQWETALLCNDVSHWLGTNLEYMTKSKL